MTVQNRVTIAEAKDGLASLIKQAREGEEVVLVEDGVEIARIVAAGRGKPVAASEPAWKTPGALAGQFAELDADWWQPDDDLAALFEGSDSYEGPRGAWLKDPK